MQRIDKRLVATAIVKDNAKTVGRVFRKLAALRGFFADLAFVVYENNSTDGTKAILQRLSREIPEFTLFSEDLSPERQAEVAAARHVNGKPCRIELIAYARERGREIVLRDYGDFDYVLAFDADVACFSNHDIVRNALRLGLGAQDCICANGLNKWLKYRDAFAFRSAKHPFGPEFLGEYWWEKTKRRIQLRLRGSALVPVYSAFGGAAIMTMDAFRAGRYSAIPDDGYMKVQRSLDRGEADDEEMGRASASPIPNSNYTKPIVCEHVPFFYSMRERGFNKVYIDPKWKILFLD
jgi:hypothetical protein